MKFLLLLAIAIFAVGAQADDNTPFLALKTTSDPNFKTGGASQLFLFSLKSKLAIRAILCVGENCVPSPGSVSNNVAAGDQNLMEYATSISSYFINKGMLVTVQYVVADDKSVYERVFELDQEGSSKTGLDFRLKSQRKMPVTEVRGLEEPVIKTYEELMASLMCPNPQAGRPDNNGNGIADDLDPAYYNVGTNGRCEQYADRCAGYCRAWKLPVKKRIHSVNLTTYDIYGRLTYVKHARLQIFVGGKWHLVEPQLTGTAPAEVDDNQATESEYQ